MMLIGDIQDTEHLLVYLLTQDYLQEEYYQTAYNVIAYIVPGRLSARFTHLTRDAVVSSTRGKVEVEFLKPEAKKKKSKKADGSTKSTVPQKRKSSGGGKGKGKAADSGDDSDGVEQEIAQGLAKVRSDDMYASDSDDIEDYEWSHNFRQEPKRKRARKSDEATNSKTQTQAITVDSEVIELSD